MVIPTRFERVTYRLGICRSILLSYGTTAFSILKHMAEAKGFSPAHADFAATSGGQFECRQLG